MAQDFTQIVDFPTRIPDCDDHQPYLLDLFLCSNPDCCTVASHSPLGKFDHLIVGDGSQCSHAVCSEVYK